MLVVCRCRSRSIRGVCVDVGVDRSEDEGVYIGIEGEVDVDADVGAEAGAGVASPDLLDMRLWRRLGNELREERALVMREGRRCRPPTGLSAAVGRADSMWRGLSRWDSGRDDEEEGITRCTMLLLLLLLVPPGVYGAPRPVDEDAHDVGLVLERGGGGGGGGDCDGGG